MLVIIMVPGIVVLLRLLAFFFSPKNTLSSHPQNGGNVTNGVSIAIPQLCVCLIGAISEMY